VPGVQAGDEEGRMKTCYFCGLIVISTVAHSAAQKCSDGKWRSFGGNLPLDLRILWPDMRADDPMQPICEEWAHEACLEASRKLFERNQAPERRSASAPQGPEVKQSQMVKKKG